jgi:glycosyltransferase involved in cell wall biosynthesis
MALSGDGPVFDRARSEGIAVATIPLHFPLSFVYFCLNLVRSVRFFRSQRLDVIMGYTSVPNLFGALAWRLSGAKAFVWGQRNAGLDRPPALLERLALRCTTAFIANSASGMDFLRAVRGGRTDNTFEISNGVDIPSDPAVPSQSIRVICLANGRPVKDHKTLLRAWSILQYKWSEKAERPRLVLVGSLNEEPSYAAEIREMAFAPDMQNSVEFTGAVNDVHSLLHDAGVGVLSSQTEGMPNAVLEYMAAGLPVVATDLPGVRQALGGGSVSGLVPVGDANALAGCLLELLLNPALRDEQGCRNRMRAITEFAAKTLTDRTWAVIRDVLP